jgi:UDP-N-acetyl-D-glucosamine dehydrogenase
LTDQLVVIGLGYVGLPLAQEACRAGLCVVGLDVSTRVVESLNAGRSHVDDLSDAEVAAMVAAGFTASTDESVLATASTVVICVPTPLTAEGGPDLSSVEASVAAVARHLHPGMLVVLESTTYPGTTDQVVRPVLEAGGLVAGTDFHLAFSPERIDPGNATYGLRNTPKVVGGQTPACTEAAAEFYGRFVDRVVRAAGTREAEMAKLLENTYRHVNIALVNEMAVFCQELGINLWDVIDCAATKPFGFQAFYPGPGVGGHCIPIDPNYLSFKVREELGRPFQMVELSQSINDSMPRYVADRVVRLLAADGVAVTGATVLLLGVTYKADIGDSRESPTLPLAVRLRELGATVRFHDPYFPVWTVGGQVLDRVPDLTEAVRDSDVTVLVQAHSSYDLAELAAQARRLLDTRGKIDVEGAGRPGVERL